MNRFEYLTENELLEVDGGFEILIFGKVFSGAAAFGIVGVGAVAAVVVVGAVAYAGYNYVAN